MIDNVSDILFQLASGNEKDKKSALSIAYKIGRADMAEQELGANISDEHKALIESLLKLLV